MQREKEKRIYNTDVKMTSQPDTNHLIIGTPIHKEDLISTTFKDSHVGSKKVSCNYPVASKYGTVGTVGKKYLKTHE